MSITARLAHALKLALNDSAASRQLTALLNGFTSSVDTLEGTGRPTFDDGTVAATVYVDSAAGDDDTGDGSASSPWATLGRAIQAMPLQPTSSRTIQLVGAGPYVFPGLSLQGLNFVTIKGATPTVLDTRTITSVGASSQANGLVLTDADAAMGVDEHRGQLVQFTAGTLNNQYGVIYENAAQVIEVTQDTQGGTFKIPSIGNTYNVLDWVTEIQFPLGNSYILESCGSLAIEDCRLTGSGKFLFCSDTEKIDWRRCRFEIGSILASRGGSFFFTTCSVANFGTTFKDWGMFTAITGGIIEINKGTVVDAVNAGAGDYVTAITQSYIETFGDVVFRDLGAKGITVRQAGIVTVRDRLGTIFSHWRFRDCAAGLKAIAGTNGEGAGWAACDLPDLFGHIDGNFAVDARLGAKVRIGANSNVTTGTVANATTVDGTNAGADDSFGTLILGGAATPAGPVRVTTASVPSNPGSVTFGLDALQDREILDIWFVNTAGVATAPAFNVVNNDTVGSVAGAGIETLGTGANNAVHRIGTLELSNKILPAGATLTASLSGGDAATHSCDIYVIHRPA